MKITHSCFWKIALGRKMESACYGLVKCKRLAMGLLNTSAFEALLFFFSFLLFLLSAPPPLLYPFLGNQCKYLMHFQRQISVSK